MKFKGAHGTTSSKPSGITSLHRLRYRRDNDNHTMAIHKKRDVWKPGARLLLESQDPIQLPPAEINLDGVTLEREEFRAHLDHLLDALSEGVVAQPAPVVMSDSIFVIEAATRTFWVRIWHTDSTRTCIDRMHVTSCLPRIPGLRLPTLR